MTLPLLEGLDGIKKMSKSLNNYIGITDEPNKMFDKIMSISDELMWRYYDLLSFKSTDEINKIKEQINQGLNPKEAKMFLAQEIVARFHNEEESQKAKEHFIQLFSKGVFPEDMEEISITNTSQGMLWSNVLKEANLTKSTSEAMRMIKEGAVKVNSAVIANEKVTPGTFNIQAGKRRFAKVRIISY